MRRGFTLAELMIVIAIMAILAGLGFSAFTGAMNLAREQRTRSQINRINALVMERWEGYRTRAVPVKMPTFNPFPSIYADVIEQDPFNPTRTIIKSNAKSLALLRLLALRALMRMELPDRRTDVVNFSTSPPTLEVPGVCPLVNLSLFMNANAISLQRSYFNKAARFVGGQSNLTNWTQQNEGAECLYLILSTMRDGDKSALDYFDTTEVGDTDDDGMPEILDGWGMPIEFIRWAPGFIASATFPANQTMQVADATAPDPFDPTKSDPHWGFTPQPFTLYPLIYSAGRDKKYDIAAQLDSSFRYAVPPAAGSGNPVSLPNDPYFIPAGTSLTSQAQIGTPMDADKDGVLSFADNITNQSNKE